jgi:hypothetical protein
VYGPVRRGSSPSQNSSLCRKIFPGVEYELQVAGGAAVGCSEPMAKFDEGSELLVALIWTSRTQGPLFTTNACVFFVLLPGSCLSNVNTSRQSSLIKGKVTAPKHSIHWRCLISSPVTGAKSCKTAVLCFGLHINRTNCCPCPKPLASKTCSLRPF